jgi:hypothetical protein
MRDIDLFQLALGLVPPWMVADAKFDADKKRLDIEIDFKTGGRFACPECGKADCPVHDTVKKTWRHLNCRDRNRARPAVGEGFPFLLFRSQDGVTVSPWRTFLDAPL